MLGAFDGEILRLPASPTAACWYNFPPVAVLTGEPTEEYTVRLGGTPDVVYLVNYSTTSRLTRRAV